MKGIRPGDEITSYNGQAYQSAKDHISAPTISSRELEVKGFHVDFVTKTKEPFTYKVKPYNHPDAAEKGILTSGILQPASYLIYNKLPNGAENVLPEGSPMQASGIKYNDRLIWADGYEIYSIQQLANLLNQAKALLTIQKGSDVFLRRVCRIHVEELRLDPETREELVDWQFESQLNGTKIQKLFYLPYNLNNEGVVEGG